jgi:hypothetical protein
MTAFSVPVKIRRNRFFCPAISLEAAIAELRAAGEIP